MTPAVIASAAGAFVLLMAALAVFQAALVAGAPIGHFAWGGQDRVLPTRKRIGSGISIGLYAVFAAIVVDRAGVLDLLPWPAVSEIGIWVLAGYFVLGIAMNGISRSPHERWTMAPLCAVLAALTVVIAFGM